MATALPEKREALRFATIDSTVALMFALLINASILILAAATFHATGNTEVAELGEAHSLLAPLLGLAIAPTLFGIALLCCGINSTVTATLAGQIVMEGFLRDPAAALAAAADHARHRHRAGRRRHHLVRRERHRPAADPHPGRAEPAALLRGVPAGDVHRRPARRWARLVAPRWLIALAGLIAVGDRRAQRQAARRLRQRLTPPPAGAARRRCGSACGRRTRLLKPPPP